jgi:hypothetical protein
MSQDGEADRFDKLVSRFRGLGADDPEGWARSEVSENIAQLARYCFSALLWREEIDRWSDPAWIDTFVTQTERDPEAPFADAGIALRRLRDLGASPIEIGRIGRAIAYEVVFGVLSHLDDGGDVELGDEFPGWRLMELDGEELTGRDVGGLHEEILSMDPSGREGRPN